MVTMVGTQTRFVDALNELLELDFDAVEAYRSAADRLSDEGYKAKIREFMADHERHTRELPDVIRRLDGVPSEGPSAKSLLTKGKVVMADLAGDRAILEAMRTNEEDTNTAYERVTAHEERRPEAEAVLQAGLADERRHRAWILSALDRA